MPKELPGLLKVRIRAPSHAYVSLAVEVCYSGKNPLTATRVGGPGSALRAIHVVLL